MTDYVLGYVKNEHRWLIVDIMLDTVMILSTVCDQQKTTDNIQQIANIQSL